MKKNITKILSIALSGVMLSGLLAACAPETEEASAESFVSIDVNPSVSLVLDENEKVLSVIAENEDAQVMIYNENIEGLSVEEATKKIADLAVELGYLNENNRGVSVTAQGEIDASALEDSVKQSFEAAVSAEGKDFAVNVTAEGLFSSVREVEMLNAELNLDLTVGEYELIVQAQAADGSLSVEAAAEMDTDELLAVIYEHSEEYIPYATEAYLEAKNEAWNNYYQLKEQLLESYWMTPYLNLANLTKYNFGINGYSYSVYTGATIALEAGIWAAEKAAKIAEETEIPETAVNNIAVALELTADETAAFKASVTVDGKVTLDSLEAYLDTYFKNMTADERAAAQTVFGEVMTLAKASANEVYTAINAEYKDEISAMIEELEELLDDLPITLKDAANVYFAEFKATIESMRTAMDGKEPLPVAYAALETLEAAKAKALNAIKAELDEADRASVESKIAAAQESFAGFEKAMNDAIAQAEQEAKDLLASMKAARANSQN
ncbi:MAG: hypothetical protein IJX98_01295 [Clostridia bacterium]|nr:hypothetical protein [Clostridia bacterium]